MDEDGGDNLVASGLVGHKLVNSSCRKVVYRLVFDFFLLWPSLSALFFFFFLYLENVHCFGNL